MTHPAAAKPQQPLPTVQALNALWQEISTKTLYFPANLWPGNWWRYVKLRARCRLQLLNPKQIKITAPRYKVNDCQSCLNLCCLGKKSSVLLHLRDLATLHDLGRTDLLTHAKPTFSPAELQAQPALKRFIHTAAWRILPILKQTAYGACLALNDLGKCTLYPHWPLSCARFPYALHLPDREVFYSKRCEAFYIAAEHGEKVEAMKVAACTAYNESIKDAVLLAYARKQLSNLGLLSYLCLTKEKKI